MPVDIGSETPIVPFLHIYILECCREKICAQAGSGVGSILQREALDSPLAAVGKRVHATVSTMLNAPAAKCRKRTRAKFYA